MAMMNGCMAAHHRNSRCPKEYVEKYVVLLSIQLRFSYFQLRFFTVFEKTKTGVENMENRSCILSKTTYFSMYYFGHCELR